MPLSLPSMSSDSLPIPLPSPNDLPPDMNFNPDRGESIKRLSLRRQSIALNAVINQRRALLGALMNEIGSNISLPNQGTNDHDFSMPNTSHVQFQEHRGHHLKEHHHPRPTFLQITPVPTAVGSLVGMDTPKNALPAPPTPPSEKKCQQHKYQELMSTLSTLYAKLLVVIGVAIPVTASVSQGVPAAFDQGYYLYLYFGSVAFVVMLYTTLMRDKAVQRLLIKHGREEKTYEFQENPNRALLMQTQQYGSFCLRLGAVVFGAGSLVFTGLQIGAEVASAGALRAITPAARLLLVTAQMHFIFLNSKELELTKHGPLAKLGLMHMIATNLCEWLQALVQETRHEINQLEHAHESEVGILMGLLTDASPFLFPCTIEFSLICAVILFEMWKKIDDKPVKNDSPTRSVHQLSIDCSSAHKGLFGGILIIAATILSLIMFFVLKETKQIIAVQQVTVLEASMLTLGIIASVGGAIKLRHLESRPSKSQNLDATLLAAAQAGVYLYCLFSIVGGFLTTGPSWGIALASDILAVVQSTIQTLLIKIAWRRRSATYDKPGKELITFLIVVNIALWSVNTLEKSRAGVRPDHVKFFGVWAWTIITHVSMPLAIFFRFHSAICLFEVWKSCYKYRPLAIPRTPS